MTISLSFHLSGNEALKEIQFQSPVSGGCPSHQEHGLLVFRAPDGLGTQGRDRGKLKCHTAHCP